MAKLFSSVFHKKTISLISIFLLSLFFIPFINAIEYEHIIAGGYVNGFGSNAFLQKYPADFLNTSIINGTPYNNFLSGIVLDGNFIYYTTYYQTTIKNGTLYKAYANNLSVITSQVAPVINPENHTFGKLDYDNDYIYVTSGSSAEGYGIAKYDKDLNFNSTSGFIYPSSPNNLKVDEEFLFFNYLNTSATRETITKVYKNNLSTYATYINPVISTTERIFAYDIDENYLYPIITTYVGYGEIRKLYKENLTATGLFYYENVSGSSGFSLIADGDLIYYVYHNNLYSIYKSNMTLINNITTNTNVRTMVLDETYLYYSGSTTSNERIWKHYKSNLSGVGGVGTGISIPYLTGYGDGRIYSLIGYSEVEQEPEPDIEAPFYTDINYIGEIINKTTTFYCEWNDNIALEPNGYWIFSTNNSGSWINDSAVNFTFTPQIAFVNKTLNETPQTIGYLFYACDNVGNCNETEIYTINSVECNIDGDCEEGYFCNDEINICELIPEPTPKSTILTNVGMAMLVVLFSIGIIKFVVGKFKK